MTKRKEKSRAPWVRGCPDEIDNERTAEKKKEKDAGMREIKRAMGDIIILPCSLPSCAR